MPWSRSRPRSRKYGHEHAKTRAQHIAALRAAGTGRCAELVCVHRTRTITADMDLHLCHDRRTGDVRGLGHSACNIREAARCARRRQDVSRLRW